MSKHPLASGGIMSAVEYTFLLLPVHHVAFHRGGELISWQRGDIAGQPSQKHHHRVDCATARSNRPRHRCRAKQGRSFEPGEAPREAGRLGVRRC